MTKAKTSSAQDKDTSYYIFSIIGFLLIFGFGYIPPVAPLTPLGMNILGIFIGTIFLWSFVSILWPSLLGIIALGMSGYAPIRTVLTQSFGDTVPILVLFAMVLFGAIQHGGVTNYISRWFLTRRIINGKPVIFSFIFIYATYALSALSADILPVLLFMWAILYSVLHDVGYKKGDPYTAIMVIGTMFGAISGQAAKPFTGSALMMVGAYEKVANTQLDYLPYMLFGVIMSSIGIVLYTLMIKFIFRPDMSKIKNISIERFQKDHLPPMDTRQKILFVSLFGYLALVLLPSILPENLAVAAFLNKLGPWGVVIAFVLALCFIKVKGKPVINFKDVAGKYIVWDVYFLVCMAMVVSKALTSPGTGITTFLTDALNPLLGGHSAFILCFVVIIFAMSITQFANNGVMGVLLMPIIQVFAKQSNMSFEALATIMIFALHVAILTPAASPFAAILYGNKDWINQKEILKYGGSIFIMTMLMFLFIGVPLLGILY